MLRAIQDVFLGGQSDPQWNCPPRQDGGGAGTLVGAAEGAAGLLLFFADMVFSRGLHVAYYSGHAFSRARVDKILLSLDTCLWKGNQVL